MRADRRAQSARLQGMSLANFQLFYEIHPSREYLSRTSSINGLPRSFSIVRPKAIKMGGAFSIDRQNSPSNKLIMHPDGVSTRISG